jgi:hypothetical protein
MTGRKVKIPTLRTRKRKGVGTRLNRGELRIEAEEEPIHHGMLAFGKGWQRGSISDAIKSARKRTKNENKRMTGRR